MTRNTNHEQDDLYGSLYKYFLCAQEHQLKRQNQGEKPMMRRMVTFTAPVRCEVRITVECEVEKYDGELILSDISADKESALKMMGLPIEEYGGVRMNGIGCIVICAEKPELAIEDIAIWGDDDDE